MRDYYNDPPETEIAPEDEKVWEILEAAGTDEESIKKVSDIINGLLCEIGRLQNKGEAEYEARAALSTEAQPEVTGAEEADENLVIVNCSMCEGSGRYEMRAGDDDSDECPNCMGAGKFGYEDPPSTIEAAVREKLEEVVTVIKSNEFSDGMLDMYASDLIDAVRALMESPHTSVEEPAN